MLEQEIAPMADIADVIQLDPAMSTLLLKQVNTKLEKSRRPRVDTVHIAMGHLGKPAIADLIAKQKTLSELQPNKTIQQNYRQLLSRNYHALAQVDQFAKLQGINNVDDLRAALLLHSLAECYVCLNDADQYSLYLNALRADVSANDHASRIFGFEFLELARWFSQKWSLPELMAESFETAKKTGRKARLIQLATQLAQQAELGWYHESMQTAQKSCADYLGLEMMDVRNKIITTAIQSARDCPLDDVFAAASRLILLPDVENASVVPAKPEVSDITPARVSLAEQIKALLQTPNANQSVVLQLLLNGLHQDLKFSRVVLMLLSSDKTKLAARASKGLQQGSSFQSLQLETSRSGILKSMLLKPQALCINSASYAKYENTLPGNFKATCLCNNFALMSIFIGNKPIGLIYCDRKTLRSR